MMLKESRKGSLASEIKKWNSETRGKEQAQALKLWKHKEKNTSHSNISKNTDKIVNSNSDSTLKVDDCHCSSEKCRRIHDLYVALVKEKQLDFSGEEESSQITNMQNLIDDLQDKVIGLQKNLDNERALRMQELYFKQKQKEEEDKLLNELSQIKLEFAKKNDEVLLLKQENKELSTKTNIDKDGYKKALQQLERYERDLFQVEQLNDMLRLRLAETNTNSSIVNVKRKDRITKAPSMYNKKKTNVYRLPSLDV